MEISIHDVTSLEMEEQRFDNFAVVSITINTKSQGLVTLKLFHPQDKSILFDFVDNFDTLTCEKSSGEVIKFKPQVAWREVTG